jgi:hypothetical protein
VTSAVGERVVSRSPVPTHRPRRAHRLLHPGWPFTAMFIGFPLWWALGLSNFIGFAAAAVMSVELVRRRRIRVPRGFGWWLLFLVTVAVGVVVLQVNAPDAVPGGSPTRYFTWAYRLAWYLSATIALLYVGNLRRELSELRLARTLGWMFLFVAAGGWLGVLVPHLEFSSALELVLPHSVTRIEFIDFLIHPQVSQLYDGAALQTPRPSAPFPYSNIWGLNFACYLPFFVVGWWTRARGLRRRIAPVLLVLALVPAVQSLNRGLWAALLVMAAFVAVRAALHGKVRALVGLLVAMVVAGAVIVLSPAGAMIQARLDNPASNEGRTQLAVQTVESVMKGSPLVGFGSTRDVQGSFRSIAGGATPQCPLCTPPSLGTQGHLWLVLFSQGVLGLVLYLGFFAQQVLGNVRRDSVYVTAGLATVLVHVVTMPVYDSIGTATFAVLLAVAMIWRATDREPAVERRRDGRDSHTLGGYLQVLRRGRSAVAGSMLVGVLFGVGWQAWQGAPASATVSVLLPDEPLFLTAEEPARTMDTEAQYAVDPAVLGAVGSAVGHRVSPLDVYVSADPNTRILNIRYTGRNAVDAKTGAETAARIVLELRGQYLRERVADAARSLSTRSDALESALLTLDSVSRTLDAFNHNAREAKRPQRAREMKFLYDERAHLLREAGIVSSRIGRTESTTLDAGHVVRPAVVRVSSDRWLVAVSSGLVCGLLVGVAWAVVNDRRGRRVRRRGELQAGCGIDVLAAVRRADVPVSGQADADQVGSEVGLSTWDEAVLSVLVHRPSACFAIGDGTARAAAVLLEQAVGAGSEHRALARRHAGSTSARPGTPTLLDAGPVVVVVSGGCRTPQVNADVQALRRSGQRVVGAVLVV